MNISSMLHVVDVLEPVEALDSRGQLAGSPKVYMRNVPCSIKPLSGREAEIARQLVPLATLQVEMWGEPSLPIDERMKLRQHGGKKRADGTDLLIEVQFVNDLKRNGCELQLLCTEETS